LAGFGPASGFWQLQVKLPGDAPKSADAVLQALRNTAAVVRHEIIGAYLHLELESALEPAALESGLLALATGIEVVSLGHRLRIFKQVGSPDQLEKQYAVSRLLGSHGIGHTRLSTESRVDLSHSQPFWAHGV